MSTTQFTLIVTFVIYLCLSLAQPTTSQAAEKANRPKIGLALSGGGARGIAHVGVLKALEELHVPIDYIAGTSMGSIAGGLYASGLSSQELRRAVESVDWNKIFNLNIDRHQLSYREKQNQQRLFKLDIGLDKDYHLGTSSGVVGGQNLFLALKRLTRGIQMDDFSKLPIPFKAIAVDVNTAETYWLEKGDLALALRASMAVPLAFAPVEIDGHLLVDGGILNNLPVDVVRAMGADIVIAVNISAPLEEIKSNSSFITMAAQSLDVALVQNTRRALENADLIITPNLESYGAADFNKGSEMIAKGYEAAIKKSYLFKGISISPAEFARYRATVAAKIPPSSDTITPTFLKFTGNKRTSTAALQGKLNDLIGHELSIEDIELETNRLMSLNDFEQITYKIIDNEQGETGLLFDVREKAWGPSYFRLGLNARTNFDDKVDFTILLRHERLNMNRFGAEWVTELALGSDYGLFTEFYQPLDYRRHFFIAPYADFHRTFVDIFENKRGIGEYDLKRLSLGVDVGINFENVAELRGGLLYNYLQADLRLGDANALSTGTSQEGLLSLRFGYDSLDDDIFPRRGTQINIAGEIYDEFIGSDSYYQKMKFSVRRLVPANRRLTWLAEANLFTFFNATPPKYESFSIGGLNYLAGYPEGDIGGQHALVLQIGGLFNPASPGQAQAQQESGTPLGVRWLGLLHAGNAWDNYDNISIKDLLYGGLGGIAWDTPFGSLLLAAGYTKGGRFNYYLSLGHLF
ncbi:MAG: patatin-like phospholipase family protein [Pseudomonadota bacterium]